MDFCHEKDRPLFYGLMNRSLDKRVSTYNRVMQRLIEIPSLRDCESVKDVLLKWVRTDTPRTIGDKLDVSETCIRNWASQLGVAVPKRRCKSWWL